jgi:hypothetical protein
MSSPEDSQVLIGIFFLQEDRVLFPLGDRNAASACRDYQAVVIFRQRAALTQNTFHRQFAQEVENPERESSLLPTRANSYGLKDLHGASSRCKRFTEDKAYHPSL